VAPSVLADSVEVELAISSDYRFRGQSRSDDRASLRLGLSRDNQQGYYLGGDLTQVRFSGDSGGELLIYGGRYFDWQLWYLEVDLRHYQYISVAADDYQALTLLLGFGPLALDLGASNRFATGQTRSAFARLSVDYDLSADLALFAGLGHQGFRRGDGYLLGELQLKGKVAALDWLLGYSQTEGLAKEEKRLQLTLSRRF